jgi:antitoxin HigA-1
MRPIHPVHPGELLLDEFLLPLGLSQGVFAARLGWPPKRLNELVTGKRGITPESAAELSRALGTSLEFWLYVQVSWALDAAQKKRAPAERASSRLPTQRVALPPPLRRDRSPARARPSSARRPLTPGLALEGSGGR